MQAIMSKGEFAIRNWLFINQISFERQKEFEGLVNPLTGSRLKLDFYLLDHMIAIEFDGEQHRSLSHAYHSTRYDFLSQKMRDLAKFKFCKSNDVRLIRIVSNDQERVHRLLNKYLRPLLKTKAYEDINSPFQEDQAVF